MRNLYEQAFVAERQNVYPNIDRFEERMGRSIDSRRLLGLASALCCPLKGDRNWQHGRVIYAEACRYLQSVGKQPGTRDRMIFMLDVGSGRGFSALCLAWAARDAASSPVSVFSYGIRDPKLRERRDSISDLTAIIPTLPELGIRYGPPIVRQDGPLRLEFFGKNERPAYLERVHFAFIDARPTYESVKNDSQGIAYRQQTGDVIMVRALEVEGVARAVAELKGYTVEAIECHPGRQYAIARKG